VSRPPVVGITCDLTEAGGLVRAQAAIGYADAVVAAGGTPVLLPPAGASAADAIRLIDALVLTGGDDLRTEPFGEPTHPRARPVHPRRQEHETALLRALEAERPQVPVLGVCMGMQLMALMASGRLDQCLPESLPTAAEHWDREHPVRMDAAADWAPPGATGPVASRHRQAVADAGRLVVAGRSIDGVIEAVLDPERKFYVGVQWHPERTRDNALGVGLFRTLVRAATG
jgi:putative glutamine amidotransferase